MILNVQIMCSAYPNEAVHVCPKYPLSGSFMWPLCVCQQLLTLGSESQRSKNLSTVKSFSQANHLRWFRSQRTDDCTSENHCLLVILLKHHEDVSHQHGQGILPICLPVLLKTASLLCCHYLLSCWPEGWLLDVALVPSRNFIFYRLFQSWINVFIFLFLFFLLMWGKKKEPALPLSIAHSVWGKTLAFISQAYRTGQQRAGRGGRHPADVSAGRMVPTTEAHRRAWISRSEPECSYHLSRIFVCRGLATFNCWWGLHFWQWTTSQLCF